MIDVTTDDDGSVIIPERYLPTLRAALHCARLDADAKARQFTELAASPDNPDMSTRLQRLDEAASHRKRSRNTADLELALIIAVQGARARGC